jgi:hypothetical protein
LRHCELLPVKELFPKLTDKTFDVTVLHHAARFNQDVANSLGLRPRHECMAGECRAVIGSHRGPGPTKQCRQILQPRYILSTDALVSGDVDALVARDVPFRNALDALAIGQAVLDKINSSKRIHLLYGPSPPTKFLQAEMAMGSCRAGIENTLSHHPGGACENESID